MKIRSSVKLEIVFDNRPTGRDLESSWGFACVVRTPRETILFDTGSDGRILLANMQKMGVAREDITRIFISHSHWDHTGGLEALARSGMSPEVLMPEACAGDFRSRALGSRVIPIDEPVRIGIDLWSSGQMGDSIPEHAMVVGTPSGCVVITGCAHPGIAGIARRVRGMIQQDISLLAGGYHLRGKTDGEIQLAIKSLRDSWVRRVAPAHCTGDKAIEALRREYGGDCLTVGLGTRIEV
jgi:7,8-dihydropterin-6-yl-methyl-4-(beta-D-ribofuranosyl)aminobenzene 5'-phosphate synthase